MQRVELMLISFDMQIAPLHIWTRSINSLTELSTLWSSINVFFSSSLNGFVERMNDSNAFFTICSGLVMCRFRNTVSVWPPTTTNTPILDLEFEGSIFNSTLMPKLVQNTHIHGTSCICPYCVLSAFLSGAEIKHCNVKLVNNEQSTWRLEFTTNLFFYLQGFSKLFRLLDSICWTWLFLN